eukprot:4526066-Prymnesium_polylepis.1
MMRCADASTPMLVAEQASTHIGPVYSVGFSPDGTRIVSGSDDQSVKVWGGRHLFVPCSRVLGTCPVGTPGAWHVDGHGRIILPIGATERTRG